MKAFFLFLLFLLYSSTCFASPCNTPLRSIQEIAADFSNDYWMKKWDAAGVKDLEKEKRQLLTVLRAPDPTHAADFYKQNVVVIKGGVASGKSFLVRTLTRFMGLQPVDMDYLVPTGFVGSKVTSVLNASDVYFWEIMRLNGFYRSFLVNYLRHPQFSRGLLIFDDAAKIDLKELDMLLTQYSREHEAANEPMQLKVVFTILEEPGARQTINALTSLGATTIDVGKVYRYKEKFY